MPNRNFVLTEKDYLDLKGEMKRLKLDNQVLRNRLTTYGMRRHQATYMPSSSTFYRCSFSGGNFAHTSGSEMDYDQLTQRSEMSSAGLTDLFTVASSIVTAGAGSDGVYNIHLVGNLAIPLRQNDSCDLQLRLNDRDDSAGVWGQAGITLRMSAYHPDVALGVGGNPSITTRLLDQRRGVNVLEGNQFKLTTNVTIYSTLTDPGVASVALVFERVHPTRIL